LVIGYTLFIKFAFETV